MLIRFKKLTGGVAVTCVRVDGSIAVQRSGHGAFFALHDLLHYAVERSLGYRQAFWGLMEAGWDFATFGDRRDQRYRQMPDEALWAEHLVAVVQRRMAEGAWEDGQNLLQVFTDEVNAEWLSALQDVCRKPLPLSPDQSKSICVLADDLWNQWARVPVRGTLELEF